MQRIYKIMAASEWAAAQTDGVYTGSENDRRDGFIHFSSESQLAETAAKHFAGRTDLMLLAVDPAPLGPALKWEPSRGGALFPHLYAPLPVSAVLAVAELPVGADGRHVFPSFF
jgi:uncharacterized protein (DUF952 family)